jgi:MoaA/NifB/PqqE/SkfB family radical SAM enzyme
MPSSYKLLKIPKGKVIAMVLHDHCNFACDYCAIPLDKKKDTTQLSKYYDGSYIDRFMSYGGDNAFVLSGGEPTLTPRFIQFIEKIIEQNRISMYTNLSTDVTWLRRYADKVDYIMAALSPYYDTEKYFEKFADKVKMLYENDVNVFVRFIATKARVPLIDKYLKYFKHIDVPFLVYPEFKYSSGPYQLEYYTENEFMKIFDHANYIGKLYLEHNGVKGNCLKCLAGSKYIYIDQEWKVTKCVNFTSDVNANCDTCCTCDIQYFYGMTGLTPVPIWDRTTTGYLRWIKKNKLDGKWWI